MQAPFFVLLIGLLNLMSSRKFSNKFYHQSSKNGFIVQLQNQNDKKEKR